MFLTLAAVCLAAFCSRAEGASLAPDGIALSTHRAGGGDGGFGVARELFGPTFVTLSR